MGDRTENGRRCEVEVEVELELGKPRDANEFGLLAVVVGGSANPTMRAGDEEEEEKVKGEMMVRVMMMDARERR